MKTHQKNPDAVLLRFEKYAKNSNEDVKLAIVVAASQAHTKKAMNILTVMVTDYNVSNDAISAIYNGYSRKQIITRGGLRLKTSLVRAFVFDRYSTYAPILISLFGRKEETITLLKGRLSSYKKIDEHAPQIVSIKLALSNLGDTSAKSKIIGEFSQNHVQNLLSIMRHLKFLDDRVVLSHVISLLKNKSNATEIGFSGGPPQYTRLCDEAMVALQSKFNSSHPRSYGSPRRFTDAELLAAYKKYKTRVAGRT